MKHYFAVRVKWQSGADSVWVETVEGGLSVSQAYAYMYSRSFREYCFTTGVTSVEYLSMEEALSIKEKPLYTPNPEYTNWGGIRDRIQERRST